MLQRRRRQKNDKVRARFDVLDDDLLEVSARNPLKIEEHIEAVVGEFFGDRERPDRPRLSAIADEDGLFYASRRHLGHQRIIYCSAGCYEMLRRMGCGLSIHRVRPCLLGVCAAVARRPTAHPSFVARTCPRRWVLQGAHAQRPLRSWIVGVALLERIVAGGWA